MPKLATYTKVLTTVGVLLSAFLSVGAFAGSSNPQETARANTTTFATEAAFGRSSCASAVERALPAGDGTSAALEKCISPVKDDADRRFKLLPSVLGPSSDAMKNARAFYAYWQSSLAELAPNAGEAREAYAARQAASATRLSELQKTLEATLPQ